MILKKQICIIIVFFVLLSQTGLAFNIHFCDSKIASISLKSLEVKQSFDKNCCGETHKNLKCCHNKVIKSQEKSETIFLKSFHFSPEFNAVLYQLKLVVIPFKIISKNLILTTYYCYSNAPPLFKRNCQFIFYA